jgi:hypothetical protein
MEKLKNKQKAIVDAITDSCEELTELQRAWLVFNLMRQQRRLSTYKTCEKDNCTLIDLRKGLIVGSSVCPKCFGHLGRADGYREE